MSIAACVSNLALLLATAAAVSTQERRLDIFGPPGPRDRSLQERSRAPIHVDPREWLSPKAALQAGIGSDETVLGVRIGDAVRAYPIARIAIDEVMNDTVDNIAIAITW